MPEGGGVARGRFCFPGRKIAGGNLTLQDRVIIYNFRAILGKYVNGYVLYFVQYMHAWG